MLRIQFFNFDPLLSISEVRLRHELSTIPAKADLDKLKDRHDNSMADLVIAYFAHTLNTPKLRPNLDRYVSNRARVAYICKYHLQIDHAHIYYPSLPLIFAMQEKRNPDTPRDRRHTPVDQGRYGRLPRGNMNSR